MGRTDTASRLVAAPPGRVYDALSDPAELARWLPPTGMSGHFDYFDLRPGGGYRMTLTYLDPATRGKTGEGTDVVEARIIDVVPGEQITGAADFISDDPAFAGTMTMTWTVRPAPGGTLVELRAENVPAGISAADHEAGLASSLANLAGLVED